MEERYWNPNFETLPWGEIESYWINELVAYLKHLSSKSDFYKERIKGVNIDKIKTMKCINEIPLLTKSELREAQLQNDKKHPFGLIQVADTDDIIQVVSSSGTTGRPVYYGITKNDLKSWNDAIATFFYTAGIRKKDIVAHVVKTPIFAGGAPYFEGIRTTGATTIWPGGLSTTKTLETMQYTHCNVLQTTVSFNLYLAEHCYDLTGVEPSKMGIEKVLAGGEPGLGEESIRRKTKELWGAKTIREIMGLSDVLPGMWAECEEETGMHFSALKHVMVELLDPATGETQPWEPGVTGEPVYTSLWREATPVIRYRSNDLVRVEGMTCECGRTTPKIRCIGRVDDMLIYKGMNVFPSAIRDVIQNNFQSSTNGYLQVVKDKTSQVSFDDPIPVDVEVLSLEQDLPKLKREMGNKVRDALNVRVDINLIAPGTLKRSDYKTPLVRVRGDD